MTMTPTNQCNEERVMSVYNFAWTLAQKYYLPKGLEFQDLVQAGMAELSKVDHRYDASRAAYTTFAYEWLRHGMTREIEHWSWERTRPRDYWIEGRIQVSFSEGVENQEEAYEEPEDENRTADFDFGILTPKERQVIKGTFYENKSLNDLASEMNYTREGIRVIRERGLEKLRNAGIDNVV